MRKRSRIRRVRQLARGMSKGLGREGRAFAFDLFSLNLFRPDWLEQPSGRKSAGLHDAIAALRAAAAARREPLAVAAPRMISNGELPGIEARIAEALQRSTLPLHKRIDLRIELEAAAVEALLRTERRSR